MCGETDLLFSLVITFLTWIFLTHVNGLLMFGETVLKCSLVMTFLTCIFPTNVDGLLMYVETALINLIFTLVKRKLHGCKYINFKTAQCLPD